VVLIGEIRDQETAEISVQASLTGHLVLSTLHTNDAPGAITRLIDMGIEPYLVASTLELVIAHRLVRLLCSHCKKVLTGAEREDALLLVPDHQGLLYGPVGCRECSGTGFAGRSGIFETMSMTPDLRHLVGERVSSQMLTEQALREGLVPLRRDGLRLAAAGRTSIAEVLRNTR
jgi:type II secretory ATPase GspE/PulE/Tfp pilus assembly ATPase PilB-like protein